MLKRIFYFLLLGFYCFSLYGCMAFMAGAAVGGTTAIWVSGRLTQRLNYSLEDTLKATRQAMKSLKLQITKEVVQANVAQIRGRNSDGKNIWINLRSLSSSSTKIEIRVGLVEPDKVVADRLLKEIIRNL